MPLIAVAPDSQRHALVEALATGVIDDFFTTPMDSPELIARLSGSIRRNSYLLDLSPLTGLPGNRQVVNEISRRLAYGKPFEVCLIDIDSFKGVSDRYGFVRASEFIVTLARRLEAARGGGQDSFFIAHIGGDDFALVCDVDGSLAILDRAITEFEAQADLLYDPEDRRRGSVTIRSPLRRGEVGLVTVSVGVKPVREAAAAGVLQVLDSAREMLRIAKEQPGSFVAVDRRDQKSRFFVNERDLGWVGLKGDRSRKQAKPLEPRLDKPLWH